MRTKAVLQVWGINAPWMRVGKEVSILHPSVLPVCGLAVPGEKEPQFVVHKPTFHLERGKTGHSLAVPSDCGLVPQTWHENTRKDQYPRRSTRTAVARETLGTRAGVSPGGISTGLQGVLCALSRVTRASCGYKQVTSFASWKDQDTDVSFTVRSSTLNIGSGTQEVLNYVCCRNGISAEWQPFTAFYKQKDHTNAKQLVWQSFQKKKHSWE